MPGTTEDVKWGDDLVFSVAGKMYAATSVRGCEHGISLKVAEPLFDSLASEPGIRPAKYLARHFWLTLDHNALPEETLRDLVRDSYRLVFDKLSKKKQLEIQAAVS